MRLAVVSDFRVINTIIATENDPAPEGAVLIPIPDNLPVDGRWLCINGEFLGPAPSPEPE